MRGISSHKWNSKSHVLYLKATSNRLIAAQRQTQSGKHQFHLHLRSLQIANSVSASDAIQWDRESWLAAYSGVEETPEGYWITDVDGEIPAQLTGTYFRNGPGRLDTPCSEQHPFDADGLVVSIAIKHGKAFFRSRFVTTREHLVELDAGRVVFPGAFGTGPRIEDRRVLQIHSRNSANTNVSLVRNKLWALYEFSQPYELDPYTLKTAGVAEEPDWITKGEAFDAGLGKTVNLLLGRLLKSINNLSMLDNLGGWGVSVHPRYDPRTGTTILHTYNLRLSAREGSLETILKICELDKDFNMVSRIIHRFPSFVFLHDIAFTKHYYIIIENPVQFDFWKYLLGQESAVGCVQWIDHTTTKAHFIRRPNTTSETVKESSVKADIHVVELPPSFVFHVANAFEEEENSVVFDAVHYKRFPNFSLKQDSRNSFHSIEPEKQPISRSSITSTNTSVGLLRLMRIKCDPQTKEDFTITETSLRATEFPTINSSFTGIRHRFVYTLAALHPYRNAPPQAIMKIDMETGQTSLWSPGAHYFAGEPVFVPNPDGESLEEDDGWLLSLSYNGETKKSEFILLDARCIEAGPIVIMKLEHHVPHGLHGTWTNKHFGP